MAFWTMCLCVNDYMWNNGQYSGRIYKKDDRKVVLEVFFSKS